MNFKEDLKIKGVVDYSIEWKDGRKEDFTVNNTILRKGRQALAKVLAGDIGDEFNFYITRMLFGDGGTLGGVKKYIDASRNGLFGTTRLSKPVISNIDNSVPEQVNVTTVIRFDELVGVTINEMATQMANGELYSMVTFPDLSKTEEMQITFNWKYLFI
jgi:hypothetical protein